MNRALLVCALLVLSSGCLSMRAKLPGTLRADVTPADVEKVGELRIEKSNYFFLAGLLGRPPADIFAADIQKAVQAKGADGVANLRYEAEDGCLDLGISVCTLYIVTPRTYRVTGDIVRIKKAPLPGRPAKVATSTSTPAPPTVAQTF
jgi:hypothetical protein